MGAKTEISWCDATWNPIRGCAMAPGSENGGCKNCYAARLHARNLPNLMSPTTGKPLARILDSGPRWTGEVAVIEKAMYLPLQWKKPKRIFVNSQSDLFHEELDFHDIMRIYMIMMTAYWHIFQVLTKRPERARSFFLWWDRTYPGHAFPSNVWLGVSIENQATAEARIPILLGIPAKVHFVSAEPLLGPIDLPLIDEIDWVIVGGESGPSARPMHPDWARSLRDQCKAAGVRFHFKQWGSWLPIATPRLNVKPGSSIVMDSKGAVRKASSADVMATTGDIWAFQKVSKGLAGSKLDGEEIKEFPQAVQA